MDTMEKLSIEEAIKVSKIVSSAPEERLPLILNILAKADVHIEGLEELEEWKALKDQGCLIDIREFVSDAAKKFDDGKREDFIRIPVNDFNEFCVSRKLRPRLVKKMLAKCGYIEIDAPTSGPKIGYTKTVHIDGEAKRCVVIRKEMVPHG